MSGSFAITPQEAHVVGGVRRWLGTANVHIPSFPCACVRTRVGSATMTYDLADGGRGSGDALVSIRLDLGAVEHSTQVPTTQTSANSENRQEIKVQTEKSVGAKTSMVVAEFDLFGTLWSIIAKIYPRHASR